MQFTLNSKWQVTGWNKDAETVSGFTSDEVIGRNFLDEIVDYKDLDAVQEVLCKASHDQMNVRGFSFTLYSKSAIPNKLLLDVSQMPAMGVSIMAKPCDQGEAASVDDVVMGAIDALEGKAHTLKKARTDSYSQCSTACPSLDDLPPISDFATPSMDELPPLSEESDIEFE